MEIIILCVLIIFSFMLINFIFLLHFFETHNLIFPFSTYTWCGDLVTPLCVTLATPWVVAHQAPLPMGFSTQEYWSGLLFPSPGDLPNPGIKLVSPALQAGSLPTEPPVFYTCSTSQLRVLTFLVFYCRM